MSWKIDKYKKEWEAWRVDRQRFVGAAKEFSHAFVNLFVEGIRHHAYTIGHIVVVLVVLAVLAFGIAAGIGLKPPF